MLWHESIILWKPPACNSVSNTLPDRINYSKDQQFVQQRRTVADPSWAGLLHTAEIGWGLRASCTRTPWPAALRPCRLRRIAQCAGAGARSAAPPPAGSPAWSTRWRPLESVNTQGVCIHMKVLLTGLHLHLKSTALRATSSEECNKRCVIEKMLL